MKNHSGMLQVNTVILNRAYCNIYQSVCKTLNYCCCSSILYTKYIPCTISEGEVFFHLLQFLLSPLLTVSSLQVSITPGANPTAGQSYTFTCTVFFQGVLTGLPTVQWRVPKMRIVPANTKPLFCRITYSHAQDSHPVRWNWASIFEHYQSSYRST